MQSRQELDCPGHASNGGGRQKELRIRRERREAIQKHSEFNPLQLCIGRESFEELLPQGCWIPRRPPPKTMFRIGGPPTVVAWGCEQSDKWRTRKIRFSPEKTFFLICCSRPLSYENRNSNV
ncbi:hypothetical protein Ddc_07660 [Ditylenchus destructor]|nr:hypothetical protein Ddc_07660 [Ditylenchus destructor]